MLRRLSPIVSENELAHALQLQIHRAGGDQITALFDDDMVRQPASLVVHATSLFQTFEPVPFEKRRCRTDQRIPTVARHIGNLLHYP